MWYGMKFSQRCSLPYARNNLWPVVCEALMGSLGEQMLAIGDAVSGDWQWRFPNLQVGFIWLRLVYRL